MVSSAILRADGDWNGDGEFDTRDFVFVFQVGDYTLAASPRVASPAAAILGRDANAHEEPAAIAASDDAKRSRCNAITESR